MGTMRGWAAGAMLALALGACGPAAGASGDGGGTVARGNARVITETEIQESSAPNLLELVQQLRPSWVQQRAVASGRGYPTVFQGSQALGSIDRLREIGTTNVREVRYLTGPEASSRFGAGVPYGVIQVILDIGG